MPPNLLTPLCSSSAFMAAVTHPTSQALPPTTGCGTCLSMLALTCLLFSTTPGKHYSSPPWALYYGSLQPTFPMPQALPLLYHCSTGDSLHLSSVVRIFHCPAPAPHCFFVAATPWRMLDIHAYLLPDIASGRARYGMGWTLWVRTQAWVVRHTFFVTRERTPALRVLRRWTPSTLFRGCADASNTRTGWLFRI